MSVNSFQTVGMANHEVITIAPALEILDPDFSAEGCTHRIAYVKIEIDSAMHPATTYAVL